MISLAVVIRREDRTTGSSPDVPRSFWEYPLWMDIAMVGLPWWLSGKVICLPVQVMQVQSLGWEDPLEKEMATHSCLEHPMDRGAWQAIVHEVAKSWP